MSFEKVFIDGNVIIDIFDNTRKNIDILWRLSDIY